MLAGQTIVGFSKSSTVTSKLQVAVFADASVTVKVTVVVPVGKIVPLAWPAVSAVTGAGQLSRPTGVAYVTVAPHTPRSFDCAIFAGHTIVGFSVSLTVTVKLHVAVLPEASVTS